ncbi:unnamed protein product [Linum tenue]|uniref:Uncharacterized protein n=1 Tax=Linum tenue TaxID=586396 RepID=A0AAV0NTL2_9ROSI|nr:unnamed protein product [Linum tenue]
MIRQRQKVSQ